MIDIKTIKRQGNLMLYLSIIEIVSRYKGTKLGFLWIWLSFAIRVLAIGMVYSEVFNVAISSYLVFLVVGISVWNLISGILNGCAGVLEKSKAYIIQFGEIGPFFYILKVVMKENIVFISTVLPFLMCSFLFLDLLENINIGYAVVGIVFLNLTLLSIGSLLAFVSVFFRDLGIILTSILQIGFLVTPVLWEHKNLSIDSLFVILNPFYHLLEIVRGPIIDGKINEININVLLFLLLSSFLILKIVLRVVGDKYKALFMNKPFIKLSNISFSYRPTFKVFGKENNTKYSLEQINLDIADKDRVALIGKNGAGKSTLLKLIAGCFPPNQGEINTSGKIAGLYGRGVGLNNLLSGRQNIKLRGMYLGYDKKDLQKKTQDIIDFIDIGEAIDRPISSYSQGMRARLSFGLLMLVDWDIYLIDEALGAGDRFFIKKARDYVDGLLSRSSILVFASHSEHLLRRFCNKAILMDNGKIVAFGDYEEVNELYKKG